MGATITLPLRRPHRARPTFAEGYGMVEIGGGAAAKVSPPFLGSASASAAVGFPMPGYKIKVVDETATTSRSARSASCC